MRAPPLSIGTIHFVGIGGIGMSGIAEILRNLGYQVQGSDLTDNANVRRLISHGIPVQIGHRAENLGAAQVIVISSAVKRDNPEVMAARARLIPVVRRAEKVRRLVRLEWALALPRAHGETERTPMVGAPLPAAQLEPPAVARCII